MSLPMETTPDSVRQWARDLPYANKAVVARESFELLEALQEQSHTSGDQMAILEAMETPVGLVLEHLQAQIISEHPKAPLFLSLGESYCGLLTQQYAELRRQLAERRGGLLNERADRLATSRQADYLAQQILFRALDHQQAPNEAWDQLQALYSGTKVKQRAPFYRMIALHLASTNRLAPRTIRDVYQFLQQLPMENLIDLKATVSGKARNGFYLPADHSAPTFGDIPANARPLDLSRLVRALNGKQAAELNPQLLEELKTRWSVSKRIKDRRITPRKPLKTTARFGLSDILQHLRGLEAGATTDTDLELHHTLPGTSISHLSRRSPELAEALIVDISDNGCRLHTNSKELRSGEIVCVNWGQDEKRIGTVIWFCKDGDQRECGIQWLMEDPQSAQLRFDTPETVHALSGVSPTSGRNILLYAAQFGQYRAICWINKQGEWQRNKLVIADNKGLVEIAEPFPVVTPKATPEKAPPPAASPTADKLSPYQDVWDALSPFGGSASIRS